MIQDEKQQSCLFDFSRRTLMKDVDHSFIIALTLILVLNHSSWNEPTDCYWKCHKYSLKGICFECVIMRFYSK